MAIIYGKNAVISTSLEEALSDYQGDLLSTRGRELGVWGIFGEPAFFTVMSFIAGFSMAGALLIPALAFLKGFLLTYVATIFLRVFGLEGAYALMLLVGTGAVVAVPCFLIVSMEAFCAATAVFRVVVLRVSSPQVYGKAYFMRFFLCLMLILAAALLQKVLIGRYILYVFSL